MVPCIRHGVADTADATLVALLAELDATRPTARDAVRSLYQFDDGEIWATWDTATALTEFAPALSDICRRHAHGVRHLYPVDLDYDYQEDVPPVG